MTLKSSLKTIKVLAINLPNLPYTCGIFIVKNNNNNNLRSKVSIMNSYSSPFELFANDADELSNLKLKANMMIAIRDLIEDKGWNQLDAASNLGVRQPRISNLKNGKVDKFSVDMLMEILVKLGFRFEFNYTPVQNSKPQLSMEVAAV